MSTEEQGYSLTGDSIQQLRRDHEALRAIVVAESGKRFTDQRFLKAPKTPVIQAIQGTCNPVNASQYVTSIPAARLTNIVGGSVPRGTMINWLLRRVNSRLRIQSLTVNTDPNTYPEFQNYSLYQEVPFGSYMIAVRVIGSGYIPVWVDPC
jgi:hypothetical protein